MPAAIAFPLVRQAPLNASRGTLVAGDGSIVASPPPVSVISPEGNVEVFTQPPPRVSVTQAAPTTCIKGGVAFAPVVDTVEAAAILPLRPDLELPRGGVPWPSTPRSYMPGPSRCACAACDQSTDCLAEPERQLEGVAFGGAHGGVSFGSAPRFAQDEIPAPAMVGGVQAAGETGVRSLGSVVAIGVATGTLIWLTTKFLDRLFFK